MHGRYLPYISLFRHFILPVFAVEGAFDGERLRVLVADDGTTLDYISRLIFPEGADVSRKGSITALGGVSLADADADVVIVGANNLLLKRYQAHEFRIIPKWVRLLLPVEEDPCVRYESFTRPYRRYFKKMIDRSKEAGIECEFVTGDEWFLRFYSDMYKPYTLSRFSSNAVVYEPHILRKCYVRGGAAIARKDGEPVAGVIAYRDGSILRAPFVGIAGGDAGLLKDGATFAVNFFLAQMAHRDGCKRMDFGLSRPFLSDGTLMYKMNWHMEVTREERVAAAFAVATPNCTQLGMKFLEAHPHFYLAADKCLRSDKQPTDE